MDTIPYEVRQCLPADASIPQLTVLGTSYGTNSVRISWIGSEGKEKFVFLKTFTGPQAKQQAQSEHVSLQAIGKYAPTLVPRPLAIGSYGFHDSTTHFILRDFLQTSEIPPDYLQLARKVVHLHHSATSSTFGFKIPTYRGRIRQFRSSSPSWLDFFKLLFSDSLNVALSSISVDARHLQQELRILGTHFMGSVLPRLLQRLEGRVVPRLVHGDLWHGNVLASSSVPGEFGVHDAGCFYAHWEYEIAFWTVSWNLLGGAFGDYLRLVRQEALVEEVDTEEQEDRMSMYACNYLLLSTALWDGDLTLLEDAMSRMRSLVEKYS